VSIRGSKRPAREVPPRQISGWKARATESRAHSCPFVSIRGSKPHPAKPLQDRSRAGKPELHEFVSIRAHSWFKTTRSRSPSTTDLGLERPTYMNSWPFVFIRGSKPHPAKPLHDRSQAGRPTLHEFVSIRVHSWFKTTPREAPSRQISGWKAHATASRVHSCPFVVQKHTPAFHP
jgi:hypothetical protein